MNKFQIVEYSPIYLYRIQQVVVMLYQCSGRTAMHLAHRNGHLEVVPYLPTQGASLTALDYVSTRIITS
jgi:hypothetical protein